MWVHVGNISVATTLVHVGNFTVLAMLEHQGNTVVSIMLLYQRTIIASVTLLLRSTIRSESCKYRKGNCVEPMITHLRSITGGHVRGLE